MPTVNGKHIEDTGWKQPSVIQTPDGKAKGLIQPATGLETKPCFTCKSWEKDNRKLIQYLVARGLKPDAEGHFETPIASDFPGRKSMRIHPRDYGYCRRNCYPSAMNASCSGWQPTLFVNDLALKVK